MKNRSSFLTSVEQNPAIPAEVKNQATTELQRDVSFLSDAQLTDALGKAGTSPEVTQAALDANAEARLDGLRAALAVLAAAAILALFFTPRIPTTQPQGDRQVDAGCAPTGCATRPAVSVPAAPWRPR
ncbi:hypothetical protein SAMN04487981_12765 [Streptomyces sp. cf386]|nr:hypothetical protein SAMN04487981_12765 [Streptomyces sp. cf386]